MYARAPPISRGGATSRGFANRGGGRGGVGGDRSGAPPSAAAYGDGTGRGRGGRGRGGAFAGRGDGSVVRGGTAAGRGGRPGARNFAHKHQSPAEGIDEQFRIDVQLALVEFRDSGDDSITFPSTLTPMERRYVHYACSTLGLVSKSSGCVHSCNRSRRPSECRTPHVVAHTRMCVCSKGDSRALTVRRKGERAASTRAPELMLHPRVDALLSAHLSEAPPCAADVCVSDAIAVLTEEAFGKWKGDGAKRRGGGAPTGSIAEWEARQRTRHAAPEYAGILSGTRMLLPSWHVREGFLQALAATQVVIVSGDTGCGKSTQVPQFILDDATCGPTANIVVTQPRRISAISLAERVSYERVLPVGDEVGYNVRLESATSAATRLTYVTTGVLLRRLTSDAMLQGVTHVVLDEVHERDVNTDCLLLLLRDLLELRPDLKVIVMSATLQLELFVNYFRITAPRRRVRPSTVPAEDVVAHVMHGKALDSVPRPVRGAFIAPDVSLVHISGSAFPVTRYYLEDILTHTAFMQAGGLGRARLAMNKRVRLGQRAPVSAFAADTAPKAAPQQTAASVTAPVTQAPSATGNASDSVELRKVPRSIDDVGVPDPSEFRCDACGLMAFASVDEFALHVVTCTGAPVPPVRAAPAVSPAQPASAAPVEPQRRKAPQSIDDIGAPDPSEFTCGLCGRTVFASVEEFAVHAVTCTGESSGTVASIAAPAHTPASTSTPAPLVLDVKSQSVSVRNLDAVGVVSVSEVTCTTCGKADFASLDDFAVHTALCFGEPNAASPVQRSPAAAESRTIEPVQRKLPGGMRARASGDAPEAPMERTAEDLEMEEMLADYHHCVNDEDIDLELLVALLAHIFDQVHLGGGRGLDAGATARRSPLDAGLGAVLVFLPGWEEISKTLEMIRDHPRLGNPSKVLALPLHGSISTVEQRKVFKRPPPGVVKIILSTNIAETSITIDDIVYVVDCGKVREKTYDAYTGCSALTSVWISQASARQRAGRAGRVRPGIAYHLFSTKRHQAMQQFAVPEMLRTPLEELCLQLKLLGMNMNRELSDSAADDGAGQSDIERFLSKAVQPPQPTAVHSAVQVLHNIGALARKRHAARPGAKGDGTRAAPGAMRSWEEDVLTPLGLRLAELPMSPRLAKMVLFSILFRCLEPVLTIACAMAYRSPFVLPLHPAERPLADAARVRFARGSRSDHLALLGAFEAFMAARARGGGHPGSGPEAVFCRENYISAATMNMIVAMREQVLQELLRAGILDYVAAYAERAQAPRRRADDVQLLLEAASINKGNAGLVNAVLAAGVYPNVARVRPAPRLPDGAGRRDAKVTIETRESSKAQYHGSSVAAADARYNGTGAPRSPTVEWLVFDEMSSVGTFGAVALRGVSLVPAVALLMLCGRQSKWRDVAAGVDSEETTGSEGEQARPMVEGKVRQSIHLTGPTEYEAVLASQLLAVPAHAWTSVKELTRALEAQVQTDDGEEEDEDADEGGDAVEPEICVDDWVRFRVQPRFAVPITLLRNRLALAFHRSILMRDAAVALVQRGRVPPDFMAQDAATVVAVAEVLSWETRGSGLDATARDVMLIPTSAPVLGPRSISAPNATDAAAMAPAIGMARTKSGAPAEPVKAKSKKQKEVGAAGIASSTTPAVMVTMTAPPATAAPAPRGPATLAPAVAQLFAQAPAPRMPAAATAAPSMAWPEPPPLPPPAAPSMVPMPGLHTPAAMLGTPVLAAPAPVAGLDGHHHARQKKARTAAGGSK